MSICLRPAGRLFHGFGPRVPWCHFKHLMYEIIAIGDRAALEDIKVELQERTQRWKKIEKICGFNVITNPGIPYLDSLLRGSSISLVSGQLFMH